MALSQPPTTPLAAQRSEEEFAPAIEKLAAGKISEGVSLLVGVLGGFAGSPALGALGAGMVTFIADLIADDAIRRMQKEEKRLDEENERAVLIGKHVAQSVAALRGNCWPELERLLKVSLETGHQLFEMTSEQREHFISLVRILRNHESRIDASLERVACQIEHDAEHARAQLAKLEITQQAHSAMLKEVLEGIRAEKGVPLALLQQVLHRYGEVDVPFGEILPRLHAWVDAYLGLRAKWENTGTGNERVARALHAQSAPDQDVRIRALELLDSGKLEQAGHLIREARKQLHAQREETALLEARMLADEAGIERLQLRFLSAANLYAAAADVVDFDDALRANYESEQAAALHQQGEEFGDISALRSSIAVRRDLLSRYKREVVPLDWAAAQHDLGTSLQTLGARETGTDRLLEAVEAYRAALQERTRERIPLYWAATQTNLANALLSLGEREPGAAGTDRLLKAVEASRAALQEFTRERMPLAWAATQNNLAGALLKLGERETGDDKLVDAVKAYRAALQERTRERMPLDWGAAQSNLGTALLSLGEREIGTDHLVEAVEAYRAALQELTRERMPLLWATTQNNLADALQLLGERETGTNKLLDAVETYRAALEERTRERVPFDWAETQNRLGNALQVLGARETGTDRLLEAVKAYDAALLVRTREGDPYRWAQTQNNLGNALQTLAARDPTEGYQTAAKRAFQGALEVFRETVGEAHASTLAALRGFERASLFEALFRHVVDATRHDLDHR